VFSKDAAQHLDLSVPESPSFANGGLLPGRGGLVSFNANGQSPTFLVSDSPWLDPLILDLIYGNGGTWMDLSNPRQPRRLGDGRMTTIPQSTVHAQMMSTGSRITMGTTDLSQNVYVTVFQPDLVTPGVGTTLPNGAVVSTPLIMPGLTFVRSMAEDPEGSLLVINAWSNRATSQHSQLNVFDVRDPQTPQVRFSQVLTPQFFSMALHQDRLIALSEPLGADDELFHSFRLTGDPLELQERGTLTLAGAHHVLLFDGSNALVADEAGLTFVNVDQDTPQVFGTFPTLERFPLSATVVDHRLVLGFEGSVTVVSPPCPPPP
jgi:hypothetical protein